MPGANAAAISGVIRIIRVLVVDHSASLEEQDGPQPPEGQRSASERTASRTLSRPGRGRRLGRRSLDLTEEEI